MRRGRMVRWTYVAGAAIVVLLILFWLEWMGGERPLMVTEVPVSQPAEKQKTSLNVEK